MIRLVDKSEAQKIKEHGPEFMNILAVWDVAAGRKFSILPTGEKYLGNWDSTSPNVAVVQGRPPPPDPKERLGLGPWQEVYCSNRKCFIKNPFANNPRRMVLFRIGVVCNGAPHDLDIQFDHLERPAYHHPTYEITWVGWLGDSEKVVSALQNRAILWDPRTGAKLDSVKSPLFNGASWSPDFRYFAHFDPAHSAVSKWRGPFEEGDDRPSVAFRPKSLLEPESPPPRKVAPPPPPFPPPPP
jgi:hypothetical protein